MASTDGSNLEQQVDNEQKQQLLQQQNYLRQTSAQYIDVRMKRHPELQPYVPSDRDRVLAGSSSRRPGHQSGVGGNLSANGAGGGNSRANYGGSSMNRGNLNHRLAATRITNNKAPNDAKTEKSKKCVSMTRLDQLAQPKKIFPKNTTSSVPSTSLSSSNATSTTTSSLTSNKNYNQPSRTSTQTANRQSVPTRQSKTSTPPKEIDTSTNKRESSVKRESVRRSSNEFNQRKSLEESRSSFVSASEGETVKLNIDTTINYDINTNGENNVDDEIIQIRTPLEDQEEQAKIVRLDEEESKVKLEKEKRLKEEEEARMRADDEARLKADEELREKARRDEEERQNRQEIVQKILSKFLQNPPENNVEGSDQIN